MKVPLRISLLLVALVLVFLLAAAPASATMDVAGWHFQDLSSHQIPITFAAAFDAKHVAWPKYDGSQADLFLLEIASGKEAKLTETPDSEYGAALDGQRLVWIEGSRTDPQAPSRLWLRDLETGATQVIAEGRIYEEPAPQIAGDHVAWAQYEQGPAGDNHMVLHLYSIGSGRTTVVSLNVAHSSGYGGQTSFDLSDTHLAYVEDGPTPQEATAWLYDLATSAKVKLGQTTASSRHVSLEGDLATWAEGAGKRSTEGYELSDVYLYRISSGATEKVSEIENYASVPKTDGRFVVWSTYIGKKEFTENLLKVVAYDSRTGELQDVSRNLFLNFTPEISDGIVVWERGGELDSEIMAHDLVSGQTTQLSANRTWMDQAAQVHGRTVVWWKHWFGNEVGVPEPPDEVMLATAPPSFGDPFEDVPGDHRYRTAILSMDERGVAGGYAVGTEREYRPEQPLLRAQFAKMICEAFDLPVTEEMSPPFSDLGPDNPINLYPHQYVAALTATGVLKGKTGTTFDPYSPVTRAQAVTILVRALDKFEPGALKNVEAQAPGSYRWYPPHLTNLRKAYANDLLGSMIDWLQQWDAAVACTRGEAAQLVRNALSLMDEEGK